MAEYNIYFKASVEKDLNKIPQKDVKKILQKIALLATNPRPSGVEKLTEKEWYRIRQGHYRILYCIEDSKLTILVIKISHRKDVYRQ